MDFLAQPPPDLSVPLLFRVFRRPLQQPSEVRYKSWAVQEWTYSGDRLPYAPTPMDVNHIPGARVMSLPPADVRVRVPRNLVATAWRHNPIELPSWALPHLSDYQQDAVSFLAQLHSGYLALPVGTGKTRVLATLCAMVPRTDSRVNLIVAPKALSFTWREELVKLGLLNEGYDARWTELRSRKKDSVYDLTKYGLNGAAEYVFIHPEILDSWKGMLTGRLRKIIVDEAHRDYRKMQPHRTQALMLLAALNEHVSYRTHSSSAWGGAQVYASSGTPFLNRPSDAYPILNILEPQGWGSLLDFRIRYCGATLGYRWEDSKELSPNLGELRERFCTLGYFKSRKELGIKLPPLTWRAITCDASKALREASIQFLGTNPELVVDMLLSGAKLSTSTLDYLTKLGQIASADKIPGVTEHVLDLVDKGGKVLVLCNYRKTVETFFEAFGKHTVCVATYGGGHKSDGGNPVAKFRATAGRVLVATYDVLGMGQNLQEIDHVVHHDLSWEPADHVQGMARAWRRGRVDPVWGYLAFAQNTLDELLARALIRKYQMISSLDVAHDCEDYAGLRELSTTIQKADVQAWVDGLIRGARAA